jgi:hypothetical protein
VNKVNKARAWRVWLSLGATAVLGAALGCGQVGGAGQCNGVEVTGMCVTVDSIQPTDTVTGFGDTSSVDAFQNPDCDGDPATSDAEKFGDHSAKVTISANFMKNVTSPPAPAFVTFTGYTVQYVASTTNTVAAPGMTTQTFSDSWKVNADESVTKTLDLVILQTKDEYVKGGGSKSPAIYTAKYTISGTSQFNQDVVLIGTTSISIGDYNLCQ